MDASNKNPINVTILSDGSLLNNGTIWNWDTICLLVIITIFSATGIMGNTPTLIIFVKRKDKHASNTFIKILAVLDLLVCMFVMPFTICYEFHLVTSDAVCRLFLSLSHFTVFASNATLVAIATERYIAVCKIGLKLTIKMVNRGVVLIIVVSAFVATPAIGVFAVVDKDALSNLSCSFPHENAPEEFCHFTYTIIGVEAVTIYQIFQAVMFVIILIVIIVLYSSVYMVLWKRTKFRKQISERRTRFQSVVIQNDTDDKQYSEIKPVIPKPVETESLMPCVTYETKIYMRRNSLPGIYYSVLQNVIRRRTVSEPSDLNSRENCYKKSQLRTSTPSVSSPTNKTSTLSFLGPHTETSSPVASTPTQKTRRPKSHAEMQRAELARARKYYYHIRTAKMLFMCTVIYFVTWIPFWLDIFGITNSRTFRYLFFIAHATNPIIYGIVNKQVRAAGKALLLSCLGNTCIHGVGIRNALRSDIFATGYFSNESERTATNGENVTYFNNSTKKVI